MMVGAEPADSARRSTDDGARFATPSALAIGPRADIDGVFQRGGHRAVMLGRNEKNRVGHLDTFAKRRPFLQRFVIVILIVDRELSYLDDAEFQLSRCQLDE